jgi:hypothetical protein
VNPVIISHIEQRVDHLANFIDGHFHAAHDAYGLALRF